jgi:hypothetical protein
MNRIPKDKSLMKIISWKRKKESGKENIGMERKVVSVWFSLDATFIICGFHHNYSGIPIVNQADTKDLSSSSKFSASCVLT